MRMVKFINEGGYTGLTVGKVYEVIEYTPGSISSYNIDVISIFNDEGVLTKFYIENPHGNINHKYFEDYTIRYRDDVINGILN